jgi:hypothetical protein
MATLVLSVVGIGLDMAFKAKLSFIGRVGRQIEAQSGFSAAVACEKQAHTGYGLVGRLQKTDRATLAP